MKIKVIVLPAVLVVLTFLFNTTMSSTAIDGVAEDLPCELQRGRFAEAQTEQRYIIVATCVGSLEEVLFTFGEEIGLIQAYESPSYIQDQNLFWDSTTTAVYDETTMVWDGDQKPIHFHRNGYRTSPEYVIITAERQVIFIKDGEEYLMDAGGEDILDAVVTRYHCENCLNTDDTYDGWWLRTLAVLRIDGTIVFLPLPD